MINASEAKAQTYLKQKQLIDNKLANVETEINKSIADGLNYCYYNNTLTHEMKLRLTELGYTVKSYEQYNQTSYKISW